MDSNVKTIEWNEDHVTLIDQTQLPYNFETVDITDYQQMGTAIKDMLVRGAPAIGIAGAFGIALGAQELSHIDSKSEFFKRLEEIGDYLKSTRPTAVNLMWAVDRQLNFAKSVNSEDVSLITDALIENAIKMHDEDIEINKKIGKHGAELVPEGATILTHCNAGALATAGYGTALGVIRAAYEKDPTIRVFADETRPRQQGAKLTAWELVMDNIPVTLITDGMCGFFMSKDMIDFVVVGADRIAANGDTANKIGTYTVAIVAKEHNIPFYIAAPLSTIDTSISSGEEIPIEERDWEEVTHINGKRICPEGVDIINPAFDVTPAKYISGIITEVGVLRPDYKESIKKAFDNAAVNY
ncbi:MAG TPA: S-methyl-5-thioribose-1-phosphate isomerase [Cyanobacteria bacterium UBA9579]|nr:S-methyl-5-thioribose-1-phosphate isomerase [Cyanobacteria bacterium UBA9579]